MLLFTYWHHNVNYKIQVVRNTINTELTILHPCPPDDFQGRESKQPSPSFLSFHSWECRMFTVPVTQSSQKQAKCQQTEYRLHHLLPETCRCQVKGGKKPYPSLFYTTWIQINVKSFVHELGGVRKKLQASPEIGHRYGHRGTARLLTVHSKPLLTVSKSCLQKRENSPF